MKNNETFSIKIVIRGERPFTPIMRLYLPANIEISNMENIRREEQMVEIAVPGDRILLSACAVRKGKGSIKAELGGMYGSEKSWAESPEILVA